MRITLNLATRPFADLGPAIKQLRIGMGALAVIAIGLGFGLHAFHHVAEQARARDHSLDGQIASVTKEHQGYQDMMRQPANALLLERVGYLNKLFDDKAFSWTLAMEDLETVLPGGVRVSTLEPIRAKDGTITLHMRVNGPRDLSVQLVSNLEHSKRFVLPRIVGETAESSSGPGQQRLEPVSASNRFDFDLLADYNSTPPEAAKPGKDAEKAKPSGEEKAPTAPSMEEPAVRSPQQRGRQPYTGLANPVNGGTTTPRPKSPFPTVGRPPYFGPANPRPPRLSPMNVRPMPGQPPSPAPGGPQ
jgi:type IV pilus assembly protein PilN